MQKAIAKFRSQEPFSADAIRHIREDLLEQCLEEGVSQEDSWDLASIFDELCCNMIDHGRATWFEVEVKVDSQGRPHMLMRDNGIEFNPAGETVVHDTYERGIGLQMIHKQAMDMRYLRHAEGINELILTTAN